MGQDRILDTRGGGKEKVLDELGLQDIASEIPDVKDTLDNIDDILRRSKEARQQRESMGYRMRSCRC